jgi:hypothetical protein
MATQSNSFQNRNSYIPPAVQKSMAAHMERVMPQQLKQYQGSGARMPARIEHEMTTKMQKNLPAHMQQYVEPYMQQNVVFGTNNSGTSQQLRTSAPAAQAYKPVQTQMVLPNNNSSRRSLRNNASYQASPNLNNPQNGPPSNNEYEFIMNAGNSPKKPLLDLGRASKFKKILIFGAGIILLLMLISIVFSFLNSAGSAQKDKLLELAQTQQEIIRVAEAAEEKIGDRNLLFKANSVRLAVSSSQQDIIAALAARGEKKIDKRLAAGLNPQNDAVLLEGEQNGNFDETYRALLQQQLNNYGLQLQAAHEGSTKSEKQAIEKAYSQLEILIEKEPTQAK